MVQFENDSIRLAIPKDGVCLENGWTIKPLIPPVVSLGCLYCWLCMPSLKLLHLLNRLTSSKWMDSSQESGYPTAGCRWNSKKVWNLQNWSTKWNYKELKALMTFSPSHAPLKVNIRLEYSVVTVSTNYLYFKMILFVLQTPSTLECVDSPTGVTSAQETHFGGSEQGDN